ncbi:hypothetical protein ASE19_16285 [Nocardioides sp. Root79]|nr:hypothetical protein ASE19_16285 [Nocardioides sp. Root79]KRC75631.1 hypothetical protein ASE20_22305 [Nocardioides sp. Root240]
MLSGCARLHELHQVPGGVLQQDGCTGRLIRLRPGDPEGSADVAWTPELVEPLRSSLSELTR